MEASGEHHAPVDLIPISNRGIECSAGRLAARIGRHEFGDVLAPWNKAVIDNTAFSYL